VAGDEVEVWGAHARSLKEDEVVSQLFELARRSGLKNEQGMNLRDGWQTSAELIGGARYGARPTTPGKTHARRPGGRIKFRDANQGRPRRSSDAASPRTSRRRPGQRWTRFRQDGPGAAM